MIQITSTKRPLKKMSRQGLRFIALAILGLLFAGSQSQGQEDAAFQGGELPLADLSGKRIDSDWFHYTNMRFGLAIDIPARGYRYVLPVNGSGMAVISADEKVWITIHSHFVVNHSNFSEDPDNPALGNAAASISRIYDHETAETLAAGNSITYSVKKKYFYVLSGHFKDDAAHDTTYYDRYTISPRCPQVFSSLRITYPKSKEREMSKFVTRLSRSLRSTCEGDDAT
jgi:hypothetical protein